MTLPRWGLVSLRMIVMEVDNLVFYAIFYLNNSIAAVGGGGGVVWWLEDLIMRWINTWVHNIHVHTHC